MESEETIPLKACQSIRSRDHGDASCRLDGRAGQDSDVQAAFIEELIDAFEQSVRQKQGVPWQVQGVMGVWNGLCRQGVAAEPMATAKGLSQGSQIGDVGLVRQEPQASASASNPEAMGGTESPESSGQSRLRNAQYR